MKKSLHELKNNIAQFNSEDRPQHQDVQKFVDRCTVVLTAGGEGSRFISNIGVHKTAYELPNGDTMIERTIRMYKSVGLTDFAVLVFHKASSIVEKLGDGSNYGVRITYSYDPEKAAGRGGAIKNALVQKKIDEGKYIIVHNPDDQIVGNTDELLTSIISGHLHNEERGGVATVVAVEGTAYHFSGMKVEDGRVTDIEMYPFIPVPAHVGMTVFSPAVFPYFHRLFNLDKKYDFESVLFPVLKDEQKLFAHKLPTEAWISVNDEKGLKKLVESLKSEKFIKL